MENEKKPEDAPKDRADSPMGKRQKMRLLVTVIAFILIGVLTYFLGSPVLPSVEGPTIPYTEFMSKVAQKEVREVKIDLEQLTAALKDGTFVKTRIDPKFTNTTVDELRKNGVTVVFPETILSPDVVERNGYRNVGMWIIIGVWLYLLIRGIDSKGKINLRFGRSKGSMYRSDEKKVTFADVAGIDEVKAELQEVVEFLKNPKQFQGTGGRMPRGILLVGPPGVGKTLLARAVAGESNVPFFSMSASRFVEMWVGTGPRRVEDFFAEASVHAPCIMFIDEVEGVAGKRGGGSTPADKEDDKTTSELLTQLDGFDQHRGIIFMCASNRPESIDEALRRPGRVDREIVIPLPDALGRIQILNVHITANKVPLAADINLSTIARTIPGFSGADIANLVNEAALFSVREPSKEVCKRHFAKARDKILMGSERKSFILTKEEKWLIAVHEVGHAIVAIKTPGADPVEKISCMPRGKSLGITLQIPLADRIHHQKSFLTTKLLITMGGRAAEHVFFNSDVSAGARHDIQQATALADAMVCKFGLSEKIGPMSLKEESGKFLNQGDSGRYTCSAALAYEADMEIKSLLKEALDGALRIIKSERAVVQRTSEELVRRTELSGEEIQLLLDGKDLPPLDLIPPIVEKK